MWLAFLAVGITVVLLIFFGLKATIRAALWKEFEKTETEPAGAGQASSRSRTEQALPGANPVQDQKASRKVESVGVLANNNDPSSGPAARDNTPVTAAAPPVASGKTSRETPGQKEMWADSHYIWVVLCKNHWAHLRINLFYRHRIPLAETDPVDPRPVLSGPFRVRCDECGKEYLYKPSEVLRFEQELPDNFTPHPLFRDL